MLSRFNNYCEPTFVIRDFIFDSITKRSFGDCYVVSELVKASASDRNRNRIGIGYGIGQE